MPQLWLTSLQSVRPRLSKAWVEKAEQASPSASLFGLVTVVLEPVPKPFLDWSFCCALVVLLWWQHANREHRGPPYPSMNSK